MKNHPVIKPHQIRADCARKLKPIETKAVFTAIMALALVVVGSADESARSSPQPGQDRSVELRIAGRSFPSVFQAWSPADNLKGEDPTATLTRHDLVWSGPSFFGLVWDRRPEGLATRFTPDSIKRGLNRRAKLLDRNPQMVLVSEIRYRDAHKYYLPAGHAWWLRDKRGKIMPGWEEGGYFRLDLRNPEFRRQVAAQCRAVVQTGVVDGVMLDWWEDDDDRLALIREVREAVGEDALIITNANDRTTPRTAPFINGYFMECYRSKTVEDWRRIANTLAWAETHLRSPRVNCVEFWYHRSRNDLDLMRAVTTLTLTHSNGYCLFSDPNDLPTPDHRHHWYLFWEKTLGKPTGAGVERRDGASERRFDHGVVVYNPMGNAAVTVTFDRPHRSLATGLVSKKHSLHSADGDIYSAD